MKVYKSIFCRIGYYCSIILLLSSIIFSNFFYNNSLGQSLDTIQTWDNCDSNFVSYDNWKMDNDSYAYFEYEVLVATDEEYSEYLNAHVYQFLDNCEYSNLSLVNQLNIEIGTYSVLEKNECAIPKCIYEQYGFKIGDKLFLDDGTACEIKFVYKDIYSIINVDLLSPISTIFLGINTLDIKNAISYCNFDVEDERPHNDLYSLNIVVELLSKNVRTYKISFIIFLVLITELLFVFRYKKEINSINLMVLHGDKKRKRYVIYFESIYIIIPTLLGILGSLLLGLNTNMLIITLIVTMITYIFNSLAILINIRK